MVRRRPGNRAPAHHCDRRATYASSVVQSVELLLEPAAERGVVRVWEALLEAGLPSQARHTAPSNRPHVTLVAVPLLTTEAESAVATAVQGRLPVDATWGAVTFFGRGPWVLVRLLQAGEGMRALQAAVARACDVPSDTTSAPERWRAHVTLARRGPRGTGTAPSTSSASAPDASHRPGRPSSPPRCVAGTDPAVSSGPLRTLGTAEAACIGGLWPR
jgi:hypothetical protein